MAAQERSIAEKLASYAVNLRYEDLPKEVTHTAKRIILDTIGCAIGGHDSGPSRIAMKLASQVSATPSASVMCSAIKTSVDLAVFANGVMIRYLDFNDGFISTGSGHPSDTLERYCRPPKSPDAAVAISSPASCSPTRSSARSWTCSKPFSGPRPFDDHRARRRRGSRAAVGLTEQQLVARSVSPLAETWRSTRAAPARSRTGRTTRGPKHPAKRCFRFSLRRPA